jgi:ABC-type multidrug transport system fused ATPase/permease subunit
VRTRTRTGQDKLAEIQNILHETVTGNRIVKAFNTELWEILRFKKAAKRLFPRQPAQRAHSVHQLAVDGLDRRHRHCHVPVHRAQ